MTDELTRREALALLLIAPQACATEAESLPGTGGAAGQPGSGGGGVGAGGTPSAGAGGALDASADVPEAGPGCWNPGAGAAGCVVSPAGKQLAEPCAFAATGLHAVLGADMFDSVLIGRDEAGLYARSAVCTHQGCNLAAGAVSATGVVCPCHGSEFDRYGVVYPNQAAKSDLPALALALGCDGQLYVDFDMPVSPAFRLKVV